MLINILLLMDPDEIAYWRKVSTRICNKYVARILWPINAERFNKDLIVIVLIIKI